MDRIIINIDKGILKFDLGTATLNKLVTGFISEHKFFADVITANGTCAKMELLITEAHESTKTIDKMNLSMFDLQTMAINQSKDVAIALEKAAEHALSELFFKDTWILRGFIGSRSPEDKRCLMQIVIIYFPVIKMGTYSIIDGLLSDKDTTNPTQN